MAHTIIQVNSGNGPKLAGDDYTDGANTVIDQRLTLGEYKQASYTVDTITAVSAATTADHILQVMAGSSLNVRIRRIRLDQGAPITTAALLTIGIYRLTSAGTGGTAITPQKLDNGDATAGATAMSLPSAKGTEGALLEVLTMWPIQTASASGVPGPGPFCEWVSRPDIKPIIIAAGTANGIAIKVITGRAGLSVYPSVDFVETSY
jgi:hypothetical protein